MDIENQKQNLKINVDLILLIVDTHFRDTFCTSLIQPCSTSFWAQLMSYIIFYSFKHDPSLCNLLEKLEKCDLEGWFLLDLLHEPNACVLPSGQETLVAHQAYGGCLVPEISTPKEFLCSGCLWPKVSTLNHFCS